MTEKSDRTKSGKALTDADIETLADEISVTEYDTESLKARRRGRPLLGSWPAGIGDVVRLGEFDPVDLVHLDRPEQERPVH